MAGSGSFAAAGPLAGYLWQVRGALLTLLESDRSSSVEIETHDDVLVRASDGLIRTCIQYKHSFSPGALTLASEELWKTLRVWIHLTVTNRARPATQLVLCTTLDLGKDLALLGSDRERNDEELSALIDALTDHAAKSIATTTEKARGDWLSISPDSRRDILRRTLILPAEPALRLIHERLDECLHSFGIAVERIRVHRERLVGWFTMLVEQRLDKGGCRVSRAELTEQLIEIREDLAPQALLSTMAGAPTPTLAEERQRDPTYLRQLDLLGADEATLACAVAMVDRARKQRDEYMQTHVVGRSGLVDYDNDLANEWERVRLRELRTPSADDSEAANCGWRIHDACMAVRGSMRGQVPPAHVANGSFHLLADQPSEVPRIGWHPEYPRRLKKRSPHE